MSERILFLTGKLAEKQLRRILETMNPDFDYQVRQIGISVAALMSESLIKRRVDTVEAVDRVLVPGRFRGDIDHLSHHYRVPFERGPEDVIDLPDYFGMGQQKAKLDQHNCLIFAEIVDAPRLGVGDIVDRAKKLVAEGADVIDLGCLPDTPFPHLEETIQELKQGGHRVSVDSSLEAELSRGGKAGADYLLSLHLGTLHLAQEHGATPVVIPQTPGDMTSLLQAIDRLDKAGCPFYADPILDPVHYGFTDSLMRYHHLRQQVPHVNILMGIGNVTELTDADSGGITALLFGVISELRVGAVLTVQVSPHCRRAVAEADHARRLFHYAQTHQRLPIGIDNGLISLHDRRPYAYTRADIEDMAAMITDRNFRIITTQEGIHVINRDAHRIAQDPFTFYPDLNLEDDAPHAFYMGVELARAHIAWQLGKQYNQDNPLTWGVATPTDQDDDETDLSQPSQPQATLRAARKKRTARKTAQKRTQKKIQTKRTQS